MVEDTEELETALDLTLDATLDTDELEITLDATLDTEELEITLDTEELEITLDDTDELRGTELELTTLELDETGIEDATELTPPDDEPPTTFTQVERAIQLLLFSQPQPLWVVTHNG